MQHKGGSADKEKKQKQNVFIGDTQIKNRAWEKEGIKDWGKAKKKRSGQKRAKLHLKYSNDV